MQPWAYKNLEDNICSHDCGETKDLKRRGNIAEDNYSATTDAENNHARLKQIDSQYQYTMKTMAYKNYKIVLTAAQLETRDQSDWKAACLAVHARPLAVEVTSPKCAFDTFTNIVVLER